MPGTLTWEDLKAAIWGAPEATPPGRHELVDAEWEFVKDLLPQPCGRGRPPSDNRLMLNGMLWVLRTGAPWRDLPEERFGPWETVYTRFNGWRADGTLARVAEALVNVLDGQGKVDWDLWCVDGSSSRATRAAGGARKKGARTMSPKTTR